MKVILAGHSLSGRSTLINRYISGCYRPSTGDHINTDVKTKNIKLDEREVEITIQCPSERGRPLVMAKSFAKISDGIFFCFPVSDRELFEELRDIYEKFSDIINNDKRVMVLGTMKDAERKVSYEEGKEFADSISAPYCEVSAATGENVNEVFEMMAREILRRRSELIEQERSQSENLRGVKPDFQ